MEDQFYGDILIFQNSQERYTNLGEVWVIGSNKGGSYYSWIEAYVSMYVRHYISANSTRHINDQRQ